MLFAFRGRTPEGLSKVVLLGTLFATALSSCGGRGPLTGTEATARGSGGTGGASASGGFGAGVSSGGSGAGARFCPDPSVSCADGCTLVEFDPRNCGACGIVCAQGELCSNGQCGVGCGAGTEQCGERCVDLNLDPNHCGACGVTCAVSEVCSGGVCGSSCQGGLAACSGECVDLELDPAHCGTCGAACAPGQVCSLGSCGSACLGGTTQCEDRCVDTGVDPSHCGTCGVACAPGQVCSMGECSFTCNGGTTECHGLCVDTDVDPDHCGGCDQGCGGDEVCDGGQCASICGEGLSKCGNACVDTETNAAHCGGCDQPCGPAAECVSGECLECDSSVDDCDEDGWIVADGDCCDKPGGCGSEPSRVNPGALEVTGNGVDDDCNGKIDLFDNEAFTQCDGGLTSDSADPFDYAKALGVCRVTQEEPAQASQRTWGLIEAKLLRANGSELGDVRARSIRGDFGSIDATQGQAMVVLSTGLAADATDTNPGPNSGAPGGGNVSFGHSPGGAVSIANCASEHCVDDWYATANPPLKNANQLPRAPDCGASTSSLAHDSVMLVLRMRAPTNVYAFSFNSYFVSAEYPEYVCTSYNDQFIALVDTPAGTPGPIANPVDKNLLVYNNGGAQWPIGINVAKGTNLFSVCAPQMGNPCWNPAVNAASCSLGTSALVGTGFEAPASSNVNCTIGGGTHWLTTAGNVIPGTIVELRIVIWDVGDNGFDSVALVDGFQWLPSATLPGTN